jgi:hypothetical protein
MGKIRSAYKFLGGNREDKRLLGGSRSRWRFAFKCKLRKLAVMVWTRSVCVQWQWLSVVNKMMILPFL